MSEQRMPLTGPRAERVKQQIEKAFADSPYPGDDQIAAKRIGWGYSELNENLKGRHWRDIPEDILKWHHDDLALFSGAGLRYYFPAYLFAAIDDFWDFRGFVLSFLHLPEAETGLRESQLRTFDAFTVPQKRAIKAFLELLADSVREAGYLITLEEITGLLADYWGREWS